MNAWERQQRTLLASEPPTGIDVHCVKCGDDLPNIVEARIHLRRDHGFSPEDADTLVREYPLRGDKAAKALYAQIVRGEQL